MGKRPSIAVRLSPAGWAGEALAAAGAVAVIIWGMLAWIRLPGLGPTHFALNGSPDSWGNARATVALLGGGALGAYALFSVLGRYPHVFNYPWPITAENAARQYQMARTLVAAVKAELVWWLAELEREYLSLRMSSLTILVGPLVLAVTLVVWIIYAKPSEG